MHRGRQLEELAFEIASSESLTLAGDKAAKLVSRGVRRVFALDLERVRAHRRASGGRSRREARGRAEGRAEALLIVLAGRGLEPTEGECHRILEERDLRRFERWLAAARTCVDATGLLAVP